MNLIINENKNPFFNLALEENLLKKSTEDFFMLWQNEPTLVVGSHQNTAAEVDVQKAKAQGVHIVRRITGGGAVYHDLGNLNFSLVKNGQYSGDNAAEIYSELSKPVIAALAQLGVHATLSGRNDILVDGKKISGCAVHSNGHRMILHGALLFNANLNALSTLLTPHSTKFEDKAIKSVSSRVANVADFLSEKISVDDFKDLIIKNIQNYASYHLSEEELANAQKLAHEKYETDEWNFTKVSAHSFVKQERGNAGNIEVRMNFDKGKITQIHFSGDFFSEKGVVNLEQHLMGCAYTPDAIHQKLNSINVAQYISGININDLLNLMF